MGLGRGRNSEKLPRILILIFAVLGRTMQDGREKNLQFSFFFPKVFMFGDSLIQRGFHDGGWCAKLVEHYERKCDFLNRGFSGYTSRMSRIILRNLLRQDGQPEGALYAAAILLGTNDSVMKEDDDRSVPLVEYIENMRYIVSEIEKHGIPREKIILIAPPPIDVTAWRRFMEVKGSPVSFSEDRLSQFVNANLQLGRELNMRTVDLWSEMLKNENWRDFFVDGLHFNQKGHEFLYERLKEHLDVILSPLKTVYPDWKDVDHIEPKKDLESQSEAS